MIKFYIGMMQCLNRKIRRRLFFKFNQILSQFLTFSHPRNWIAYNYKLLAPKTLAILFSPRCCLKTWFLFWDDALNFSEQNWHSKSQRSKCAALMWSVVAPVELNSFSQMTQNCFRVSRLVPTSCLTFESNSSAGRSKIKPDNNYANTKGWQM